MRISSANSDRNGDYGTHYDVKWHQFHGVERIVSQLGINEPFHRDRLR